MLTFSYSALRADGCLPSQRRPCWTFPRLCSIWVYHSCCQSVFRFVKILYAILVLFFVSRWGILTSSNSTAEMVTYLPIASPFIRLSGFWVDEALSFAMGWNYFFLMGTWCIMPPPSPLPAESQFIFSILDPRQLMFSRLYSLRYTVRDYCDRRASYVLDRQDSGGRNYDCLLGDLCVRTSPNPLVEQQNGWPTFKCSQRTRSSLVRNFGVLYVHIQNLSHGRIDNVHLYHYGWWKSPPWRLWV